MKLMLLPNHPYIKHGAPCIMDFTRAVRGSRGFMVKWRDFMSVKQDIDCSTLSEAQEIAKHLPKNYLDEWDFEQLECHGHTYESMTRWWKGLG